MSQIVKHPAPYPEVNTLLQELLDSVQTILGSHFVGAYLFGSLLVFRFLNITKPDEQVLGAFIDKQELGTLESLAFPRVTGLKH